MNQLGEKLHPGEFARQFPKTATAFTVLRDDLPFTTFNSGIEKALAEKNINTAVRNYPKGREISRVTTITCSHG